MVSERSKRSVLIVDDSAFIRAVVHDVVSSMPDLYVAGEASSGDDAISLVESLRPDVLTLDIEMPGRDGLSVLEWVMRERPTPVVMLSGRDDGDGATLTIRALELGAVDFVRKPSWASALDVATLQSRLPQALRMALRGRIPAPKSGVLPSAPTRISTPMPTAPGTRHSAALQAGTPATSLIVIAASTGGPRALTELFADLPLLPDSAVVVVQHMPAPFTLSLATRLDQLCSTMPVVEISAPMQLCGGHVYVAPGGQMLTLAAGVDGIGCEPGEPGREHRIYPAADPVLLAAAQLMGDRVAAIILTGMGRDGAEGARAVKASGGRVFVQDPAQCVVSGMVAAVLEAVEVDGVVPMEQLPLVLSGLFARENADSERPSRHRISASPKS